MKPKPDTSTKSDQKFSLKQRVNSFRYAWHGLQILFRFEHNARIHALAAIVAVAAAFYFNIHAQQWIALMLVITLVLVTEIINTALERVCNALSSEIREDIRAVKDLAAAAVLLASVVALITGLIIFIPYIINWFNL